MIGKARQSDHSERANDLWQNQTTYGRHLVKLTTRMMFSSNPRSTGTQVLFNPLNNYTMNVIEDVFGGIGLLLEALANVEELNNKLAKGHVAIAVEFWETGKVISTISFIAAVLAVHDWISDLHDPVSVSTMAKRRVVCLYQCVYSTAVRLWVCAVCRTLYSTEHLRQAFPTKGVPSDDEIVNLNLLVNLFLNGFVSILLVSIVAVIAFKIRLGNEQAFLTKSGPSLLLNVFLLHATAAIMFLMFLTIICQSLRLGHGSALDRDRGALQQKSRSSRYMKSYWIGRSSRSSDLAAISDEIVVSDLFERYSSRGGLPSVILKNVSKSFGNKQVGRQLLQVREHLIFFGRIKGATNAAVLEETEKLVRKFEFVPKTDVLSKKRSGGMKRKLSSDNAMVGGSSQSFVSTDDHSGPANGWNGSTSPTLGVDRLAKATEGKTIVLTTHYVEEADVLGDRITFLLAGTVMCSGSPIFLKQKVWYE
ncbi:ATP-binding cassette sub-family A member 1-like [Tropilaelaps mercedesae]|uniref:ATP-binding cassette sub-family A member 1-like n=1 Tax=Tropilaelaps mercedesae TaxID=418985 RepID=A0A1V9X926_9ACAR|nr:ATP-binding cassette sub-family A member 1-like [Tropilaelaps mercedesae]